MTPKEIRSRRLELELTPDEFAFALHVTEADILAIEAGESEMYKTPSFLEAFEELEERVFSTMCVACP